MHNLADGDCDVVGSLTPMLSVHKLLWLMQAVFVNAGLAMASTR
jgi:hypothetical protein